MIALLLECMKIRGLKVVLRRKWPFLPLTRIYIIIIMLLVGNIIICYRAAIGAFYSVTHKLICREIPLLNLNIRYFMYCVINIFCLLGFSSFVRNYQFKFYRLILLLMCMIIVSNPGPESN